jgi:prepilin-type N-terminal cleavage/methylation domain-containing protein
MTQKSRGFTLVEIVMVLAILVFLAAGAASAFSSFTRERALTGAAESVLSLLRSAHGQTLAAKNDASYGVHFASSTVTLFRGATYVQGGAGNVAVSLDSRVIVSVVSLSDGGSDVHFTRLTGEAEEYGTITVALVSTSTRTARITVSPSGLSEIN